MRVREVMTDGVQTVRPTMPATDAWDVMKRARIRHLIVSQNREVVGVLSSGDTGGRAGNAVRAGKTVADLMTRRVVSVGPEDTIRSVANVMRGRSIGCVAVVDRGRLVGILTLSDLLEVLGRGLDRPAEVVRRNLHYRVPHRKRARARAAGAW